jgi:hypothetical protein
MNYKSVDKIKEIATLKKIRQNSKRNKSSDYKDHYGDFDNSSSSHLTEYTINSIKYTKTYRYECSHPDGCEYFKNHPTNYARLYCPTHPNMALKCAFIK